MSIFKCKIFGAHHEVLEFLNYEFFYGETFNQKYEVVSIGYDEFAKIVLYYKEK